MPIIEVEELRKTFHVTRKAPGLRGALAALVRARREAVAAVDGISFTVEPGEMVGYIGVNGAGKSTTIKLLTGILVPSGGRVRVLGRDPHQQRQANARDIGVVFGQRSQLWWDLPVLESLRLIGRIYQMDPARLRRQLDRFTEVLDLGPLLPVPVRALSLGQKMRAELAATLLHEPRVVYLDEPTIGLDLLVKERIREFIKQVNREQGTTVVLTTHDLGDIEELCRRVVVIDAGRLLWDGPLSTLRERLGTHRRMIFDTAAPIGELALPPGVEVEASDIGELALPPGVEVEASEPRRLALRFDRARATASQVATAVMGRVEVIDFRLDEPDLSSVIRQIYGGALRGGAGAAVTALAGRLGVLLAIGAMALKRELAERSWFWMQVVVRLVTMVVLAHFWRAVYAGTERLGGLAFQQTLDYALLAQVLAPLSEQKLIVTFDRWLRSGNLAIELLRPVDLQASEYASNLAGLVLYEAYQLPLLLVAWAFLGLRLPGDPLTWAAFLVTLLLGHAVLFFADWLLACLAFYTTETWGIGVLRHALSTFFGGALLPLAMLPGWLREVAAALPFAQGISAPTLVLAGVTPLAGLPAVWGVQLLWLVGLWLVSRLAFSRAVRQVTVHGG